MVMSMTKLPILSLLLASLACGAALAQPAPSPAPDPLSLPTPRPSAAAYQWGIEMLKFDRAWAITRGRAHIAVVDITAIADHEDLGTGIDGPLRPHLSQTMLSRQPTRYHSTMVVGVAAARGMNGKGISGGCPYCSVSLHDSDTGRDQARADALGSGGAVMNLSAGGYSSGSCAAGDYSFASDCAFNDRAEERDIVYTIIAGNSGRPYAAGAVPGGSPNVVVVGGLQSDGRFWTEGYDTSNRGSDYGAGIRLVAPAKDVLTTHPPGGQYFDSPLQYCGDRVEAPRGMGPTLGPEYSGYGDCHGTSFSAPIVSALAALMRSANPLLSAAEVREIMYETATTPVAGPTGSNLTFYIPDAEAAVKKAIGTGLRNRTTPMFSLFAPSANVHLFTTSPQTAVAGAAGELRINGLSVRPTYESFGDEVAGYTHFTGRICEMGSCRRVAARSLFEVFTTENSPDAQPLVPLYRMSLACAASGCPPHRTFTYSTSDAEVRSLQSQGWSFDMIEGYVYAPTATVPGAMRLCLAYDGVRKDRILYAAATCGASQLVNSAGASTGGDYAQVATLGYLPAVSIPATRTGLWWNASESGWGVNFTHQGDLLFATLFTYSGDGRPMWLAMPAGARQGESETFSGPLYRVTGSPLAAANLSPIPTAVGTMTAAFAGEAGTLEYTIDGTRVTKQIRKQVYGRRAAQCRESYGARTDARNYQDLWYDPRQPGWGVNITHQDATLFATLFTYDEAGRDVWYVMSNATLQADGSFSGDLFRTRGPAFNADPFTPISASDVTQVGTMRLQFADGMSGTMTVLLTGAAPVEKSISRQVFSRPASGCKS
jgi:hypothetical protein